METLSSTEISSRERACLCALNRIFGYKPKIGVALVTTFGSAEAVFALDQRSRMDVLGRFSGLEASINGNEISRSESELELLKSEGYGFMGITEDDYPALLRECEDPPLGLYYRAASPPGEIFNRGPCIAIVGTRDISPYGREWCRRITEAIAEADRTCVIVSGLAYGVDITAHRTALESGVPTIGVMATGIDSVYPWRHESTAEKMASTGGCALVSDFPPGTMPKAINFLRRNRIIAGMSRATVLVESKIKGGGMMTARLAYSYERDVFSLPGRIDDIRSQGCNVLIKDKIAEPVISPEDLVERLGLGVVDVPRYRPLPEIVAGMYGGTVDMEEVSNMELIADLISKNRGITVEELCGESGLSYGTVAAITGRMEGDGLIRSDLMQRCFVEKTR